MTSATPDKVVGTTFKSVLVNETGEFVVGTSNTTETSRVHLDAWTLETGKRYPSYNGSSWFPNAEKYLSVEIPMWYTTLTLSNVEIILHNDTTRTAIVINLLKNWTSFHTFTLPNWTSTLSAANTTSFVDGDRFSVEVTTGVAWSNIAAEIFLDYNLS